jgi:hypothetical protein
MALPNCVGIGAQRAATTWIYSCLREHPEIFVPAKKELHFFDVHYDEGLAWYEAYFEGSDGYKAVAEVTPSYLCIESAIPRMAEILPEARLFAVLREPVQRAYSAYKLLHEKYRGLSFREACEDSDYLIRYGLYAGQIERLFRYYPRERVKILIYDDITRAPGRALADLFAFLGVDTGFVPPSTYTLYNRVMYPKVQAALKRAGLHWGVDLIKGSALGSWIKRREARRKRDGDTAVATDAAHLGRLKTTFRDDILRLQDLIGRDLSAWL